MIPLLTLSDEGAPGYDHRTAAELAALGRWASAHDIVAVQRQ